MSSDELDERRVDRLDDEGPGFTGTVADYEDWSMRVGRPEAAEAYLAAVEKLKADVAGLETAIAELLNEAGPRLTEIERLKAQQAGLAYYHARLVRDVRRSPIVEDNQDEIDRAIAEHEQAIFNDPDPFYGS